MTSSSSSSWIVVIDERERNLLISASSFLVSRRFACGGARRYGFGTGAARQNRAASLLPLRHGTGFRGFTSLSFECVRCADFPSKRPNERPTAEQPASDRTTERPNSAYTIRSPLQQFQSCFFSKKEAYLGMEKIEKIRQRPYSRPPRSCNELHHDEDLMTARPPDRESRQTDRKRTKDDLSHFLFTSNTNTGRSRREVFVVVEPPLRWRDYSDVFIN